MAVRASDFAFDAAGADTAGGTSTKTALIGSRFCMKATFIASPVAAWSSAKPSIPGVKTGLRSVIINVGSTAG